VETLGQVPQFRTECNNIEEIIRNVDSGYFTRKNKNTSTKYEPIYSINDSHKRKAPQEPRSSQGPNPNPDFDFECDLEQWKEATK
jgi:hypothetical protein